MSAPGAQRFRWPTRAQELLIDAVVAPHDDGLRSLERWLAENRLEDMDPGSARLLPQIYRRFGDELDEACRVIAAGTYKKSLYGTSCLLHLLAGVLDLLDDRNIPVILLKGTSDSVQYHAGDPAVRPSADLDLLVPDDCAERAVRLLSTAGLTSRCTRTDAHIEHTHYFRREAPLRDERGQRLDLHWALFQCSRNPRLTAELWHSSRSVDWRGRRVSVLDPTHDLFVRVVHGVMARPTIPPFRWIVDAHTILQSHPIDWQRLVPLAASHGVTRLLRDGLDYLRSHRGVDVPEEVVAELSRAPIDLFEEEFYVKSTELTRGDGPAPSLSSLLSARCPLAPGRFRRSLAEKGRSGRGGPWNLAEYPEFARKRFYFKRHGGLLVACLLFATLLWLPFGVLHALGTLIRFKLGRLLRGLAPEQSERIPVEPKTRDS